MNIQMANLCKKLTMASLGENGRFGNQFFQYIFIKCYARSNNCDVEIPKWIGSKLFRNNDAEINVTLPRIYELSNDIDNSFLLNLNSRFFNCDLWGWFQFHTDYYQNNKEFIRRLFTPIQHIKEIGKSILDKVYEKGKTLITIHLRRGDANSVGPYYYAPTSWYLEWLHTVWTDLEDPVLYIATDDPDAVLLDFASFNPLHLGDFKLKENSYNYYFDFFLMQHSDLLSISNSTFSFSASMLNEKCLAFYRPSLELNRLVTYEPWSSEPIMANKYEPNNVLVREVNSLLTINISANKASTAEARLLRQKFVNIWLATNEYELEPLFHSNFGMAYCSFLHSTLKSIELDSVEKESKEDLLRKVNAGMNNTWFMQYLLSAMLLCQPGDFAFEHDMRAFPQWFLPTYLNYLKFPFLNK